jgi:hypothetical protein
MKVFVLGALLVQTLVAQATDDTSVTSDGLAPLLTPASDAPAEIDLLGTPTDSAIGDFGAEATVEADAEATASSDDEIHTLDDLPTGTADVVLDASPTETTDDPTITDDTFGGGESAVDGVVFDGSEFNFPTPVSDAEITPTPNSAVNEPVENDLVDSESASSDDLGLVEEAITAEDFFGDATSTEDFGLGTAATATADAGHEVEASVEPSDSLDFADATVTDDFSGIATDEASIVEPDFGAEATVTEDSFAAEATFTDNGLAAESSPSDVVDPSLIIDPFVTTSEDLIGNVTPVSDSEAVDFATLSDAILESTDIATASDAFETVTDPVIFPDFGATASAEAVIDAAQESGDFTSTDPEAVDIETAVEPLQTDPPAVDIFEGPTQPEVTESSSIIDLSASNVGGVSEPEVTPGPESDNSAAAAGDVGVADADVDSPGAWTGDDESEYEGQDYGYDFDDSQCPAYCLEEGYDADEDVAPYDADDAEEDDSEYDLPLVKRIINWLRPRQAPSSSGGFAAFSWPGAKPKEDTDECTEDVPEWLYESSGKKHKDCKVVRPKCPASCYSTTPSESTGSYNTRSWTKPHWSHKTYPASSVSDGYVPYSPVTTPDASTSGGYSTDYYDTTATDTQTTFVTSTTTAANGYYDDSSKGYTGNTLDTLCPKQCNPFDPAANKCDITTSCTTTGNGKYYCACRAGYRPGAWNEKDFSKMFKFKDQPYVYGAVNMVCDKLCSDQTCSEVIFRPQCQ